MTDGKIVAFCGKLVSEMEKDELLEVIDYAFGEIQRLEESERKYAMMAFN
jgi:hypothetical protein